ncbi:hypothetical protein HZS_3200, partial [Henneguya salminicola]
MKQEIRMRMDTINNLFCLDNNIHLHIISNNRDEIYFYSEIALKVLGLLIMILKLERKEVIIVSFDEDINYIKSILEKNNNKIYSQHKHRLCLLSGLDAIAESLSDSKSQPIRNIFLKIEDIVSNGNKKLVIINGLTAILNCGIHFNYIYHNLTRISQQSSLITVGRINEYCCEETRCFYKQLSFIAASSITIKHIKRRTAKNIRGCLNIKLCSDSTSQEHKYCETMEIIIGADEVKHH